MSDLFDPQPREMPKYGSLTPSQEKALHDADRPTWYAYVAETMAKKLIAGGAESIAISWPLMSETYKRALWPHFDEPTRELVRLVRRQSLKAAA